MQPTAPTGQWSRMAGWICPRDLTGYADHPPVGPGLPHFRPGWPSAPSGGQLRSETPSSTRYASCRCPRRPAGRHRCGAETPVPGRRQPARGRRAGPLGRRGCDPAARPRPERRALLVERCRPGNALHHLPIDQALDVVVGLLPRLWLPAGAPFTPLAEEAAGWMERMPGNWERAGRPYERRMLDAALGPARRAGVEPGRAGAGQPGPARRQRPRRHPRAVAGDRPEAAGRRAGVRGGADRARAELGHFPAAVRHRLDRLTAGLGLDRERVRGWTIGQTLAWSIGGDTSFRSRSRWCAGCSTRMTPDVRRTTGRARRRRTQLGWQVGHQ